MVATGGCTEYNVGVFNIHPLQSSQEASLACPFFMPTRRFDAGEWLHPSRLPLGCGWEGYCTAPDHHGETPEPQRLKEECSLGYASNCPHLPAQRAWDAVRFAVSSENESHVLVAYVCEKNHLPAENGNLEFRFSDEAWARSHSDLRVQRMAECFLDSWRARKRGAVSSSTEDESIHEQS